jgi:hypothetical protein
MYKLSLYSYLSEDQHVYRKLKQISTSEHTLYVICRVFQKLCIVTQYKTVIVRAVRNAESRNYAVAAATARISNYYLSQDIQHILCNRCASSKSLSSSGVILLYSVSVSLLK